MADELNKPDAAATFYKVRTLNLWFFASAAVLTITYFVSVLMDHDREWKQFQWDFMEREHELAVEQGQKAFNDAGGAKEVGGYTVSEVKDAKGNPTGETRVVTVEGRLPGEIERLETILAADQKKRPRLAKAVEEAQFEFNVANADMKAKKAAFEAERFKYEEAANAAHAETASTAGAPKAAGTDHGSESVVPDILHPTDPELASRYEEYKKLKLDYERLDNESKDAESKLEAAKKTLAEYDALVEDVRKQLETKERDVNRMEKRADSVDKRRWFTRFRNSLLFNFMAPTVTPKKIVVNEIFDELNFLKVPKVDMCITCHLASDRNKDYEAGDATKNFEEKTADGKEQLPQVFRSHSQPELFATSLSPHPQDRFGCTGCHQGANQRLSFELAAHSPTDEAEGKRWESEYKWHRLHEWDYPMLSSRFFDASCYKCHTQEVNIPGAAEWNRGRNLVEKYGCYGCHKMAPFDGRRKVGPPLSHVVSKFQNLDFMLKWVDDPTSFRSSSRMPSFFHLENRSGPDEAGRAEAEVTAIVSYVYSLATPYELDRYPGNGSAERGKAIVGGEFGGKGCLACHNVGAQPGDDFFSAELGTQRHAPDLSGIGSKVTADWLYTWIRDPKRLFPDTFMPSVRLTDEEAADVVAYLMTKRNESFDQRTFVKPVDDAWYDRILEEKLTERMTADRAKDEVKLMSGLEKRRRSGEFLVNHYGCFGCHIIPGYEETMPIGTELNGWGSKHPDRLDFGEVEMEWKRDGKFTREDWLAKKLKNTRFYDQGKDKKPFEKLKMPQFGFLKEGTPDADREAVMTFVMSLTKDTVAQSIQRTLSPADQAVERGKQIVRNKNCFGCHVLYGEGGEIRKFIDDYAQKTSEGDEEKAARGVAFYPPVLDGQGARTQHDWLFRFLNDPSQGKGRGAKAYLRPWMKARMPTFGFTQEELNDLVAYFAHEEVWQTASDRELWNRTAEKFRKDFQGYDARALSKSSATRQQLFQKLVARLYRKQGGHFLADTDFPYLSQVDPGMTADHLEMARPFFKTLNCALCHAPGGVVPKGKSEADMAPDLSFARNRLQPKWVVEWLHDPAGYQPGTRMPKFWSVLDEKGTRQTNNPAIHDAEQEMRLIRDYLFASEFADDYRKSNP